MHVQIQYVIDLAATRAAREPGCWVVGHFHHNIEHNGPRGTREVIEVASNSASGSWAQYYGRLGLSRRLTHDDHGVSPLYSYLGAACVQSFALMRRLQQEQPHHREWFDIIQEIRLYTLKAFGLPEDK